MKTLIPVICSFLAGAAMGNQGYSPQTIEWWAVIVFVAVVTSGVSAITLGGAK